MSKSAVAAAIEKALRDHLILTDRPHAALLSIAEELFAAMGQVSNSSDPGTAEALDFIRFEFGIAIETIWRECGPEEPMPPLKLLAAHDEMSALGLPTKHA
jgi:hypothetical protein